MPHVRLPSTGILRSDMRSRMAMVRSILALLLPAVVLGATLNSEKDSALVRRQREDTEVVFGSGGQLQMLQKDQEEPDMLCRVNFTMGKPLTTNCTDDPMERLLEASSRCKDAAKSVCPDESCLGSPFEIDVSTKGDNFPAFCYRTGDGKFYWNGAGYWPANITTVGNPTPVCQVPQYLNGTVDSNDCGNDLYVNVFNEDHCRNLAICRGYAVADVFQVLNTTEQQLFPAGCHIRTNLQVEFNTIGTCSDTSKADKSQCLAASGTWTEGVPTSPVGTPICRRKDPMAAPGAAAATS